MTQEINNNKQHSIGKWVTDVRFIIIIITVVLSAVFFVTAPDTELKERMIRIEGTLDTIKNNHLVHIQSSINDNKKSIEFNQQTIIELLIEVRGIQEQIKTSH